MQRRLFFACLSFLTWFGCASESLVEAPEPARPMQPHRQALLDYEVSAIIPLGVDRFLVGTEEGLRLIRGPEDPGVLVADPGDLGDFQSVNVRGDTALLAGSGGVFALHGTTFFVSPLQQSLAPGETVQQFLEVSSGTDGSVLWMLTDRALYRVIDDVASRLGIEGVEWEGARLGRAPGVSGTVVWLATSDAIYEIGVTRNITHVGRVQGNLIATAMATDGSGQLWLVADSSLYRLRDDRRLVRYQLPVSVDDVLSSGAGPDIWIRGEGALWHFADGEFRFVDIRVGDDLIAPEADGRFLLGGPDGLVRYRARHPLSLVGVTQGARITGPVEVQIVPHPSERPRVEAFIDGLSIAVLQDPFRVSLDPAMLGTGSHRFRVEAHYEDGTLPAFVELDVIVGENVTWAEHIEPLHRRECARCHGEIEDASTRLDSRERWIDNIEAILYNVAEGRMPLGDEPLAAGEVDLIAAWKAAGFPE